MSEQIRLQTVAHFGKADGASDYDWLFGRDAVPAVLFALCESLSQASASSRASLSLVTEQDQLVWLVRTYFQGTDNSFRPIAAIEFSKALPAADLSPEQMLRLAAYGIQRQELDRGGGPGTTSILLPSPRVAPEAPDRTLLARIRLGLPVSVPTQIALWLTNHRPWRYRGICFASSGWETSPPGSLSPYLCVNFPAPNLSEEERAALDAALGREITEPEWQALDRLDALHARAALRWSVAPAQPMPAPPDDARWRDWLLAYRRTDRQGIELLRALRSDLQPNPLPADLIRQAAPELSQSAAGFLVHAMTGNPPEVSAEGVAGTIEELARLGYLDEKDFVPLRFWAGHIIHSPFIADAALRRLESAGIDREAARFALDLPPARESFFLAPELVRRAVQTAFENGIPVPRRNAIQILDSAQTIEDLRPLEELSEIHGGWAAAVWEMAQTGAIPERGLLTAKEMAAVTGWRRRFVGNDRAVLLDVLTSLVREGREEEAREFCLEANPLLGQCLQPASIRILRARFESDASAAVPATPTQPIEINEMKDLAERGLARPKDILPPADGVNLDEYAGAWPETLALAALIAESDERLPAAPPAFPEEWRPAIERALTGYRVERWLEKLPPDQLSAAREWLGRFLGPIAQQPFLGDSSGSASPAKPAEKDRLLLQLKVRYVRRSRKTRLERLAQFAFEETARGDDRFAQQIVEQLLPEKNEQAVAFAAHALSGVGALPSLSDVPPDLVAALAPMVDTRSLLDRIFADARTSQLSTDRHLVESLVKLVEERGIRYPEYGYARKDLDRHRPLTERLSQAPGWPGLEGIALGDIR